MVGPARFRATAKPPPERARDGRSKKSFVVARRDAVTAARWSTDRRYRALEVADQVVNRVTTPSPWGGQVRMMPPVLTVSAGADRAVLV
jgi:hypothetical protein